MKQLSCRHTKIAAVEMTQQGVGVSTTVRMYVRRMVPNTASMRNAELNEMIASEFLKGEPIHRFRLTKGDRKGIAEIRRSTNFFYIASIRDRGISGTSGAGYDIIVIQPSMKDVSEESKKRRLEPGWGFEYTGDTQ